MLDWTARDKRIIETLIHYPNKKTNTVTECSYITYPLKGKAPYLHSHMAPQCTGGSQYNPLPRG